MSPHDADGDRRHPAISSFARGMRLGLPIFLGYLPVGAAFGVVAAAAGTGVAAAVACSALVLAGAGQFIGLQLLKGGAGLATAIIATTVVNLRYVLFSATMSPYLRETPWYRQAFLAFSLTDETFAINITDSREGLSDDWSKAGVGFVSWVGWTAGTALGATATALIGDPSKWGVDFALPAMFTALLVAQLTEKKYVVVAGVAAATALALSAVLPGEWPVIAGAMAAATAGAVMSR
jgi:4-azaleucine resistance transporter AzlC